MSDDGQVSKRRVYDLPLELVDRITAFQQEKKLPSEVEAVRRLLDEALKYRDTPDLIIARFKDRLREDGIPASVARDVLSGHPLVATIDQSDMDAISFKMKDGGVFMVNAAGKSYVLEDGYGDRWQEYPPTPKAIEKQTPFDDDIPF